MPNSPTTMRSPTAAASPSQPAQKKPRRSNDAMFAASLKSRKKTLKNILFEVIKENPDVKKGLALRTKKAIIDKAMQQFQNVLELVVVFQIGTVSSHKTIGFPPSPLLAWFGQHH